MLDLHPATIDHFIGLIMLLFRIDRNTAALIFAQQFEANPDYAQQVCNYDRKRFS